MSGAIPTSDSLNRGNFNKGEVPPHRGGGLASLAGPENKKNSVEILKFRILNLADSEFL